MSDTKKPIIIIPEGGVSEVDIEALRENGCCVISATNPDAISCPIVVHGDYTIVEASLIKLGRWLLECEYRQEKKAVLEKFTKLILEADA